jgi:hypothetical protein
MKRRIHAGFWFGKPEGRRAPGMPERKWKDNIKTTLQGIRWEGENWFQLTLERNNLRTAVNPSKNLQDQLNSRNVDYLKTYYIFKQHIVSWSYLFWPLSHKYVEDNCINSAQEKDYNEKKNCVMATFYRPVILFISQTQDDSYAAFLLRCICSWHVHILSFPLSSMRRHYQRVPPATSHLII